MLCRRLVRHARSDLYDIKYSQRACIVEAIRQGDLEYADSIFAYAAQRELWVDLCFINGDDVLMDSIRRLSYERVRFVLEKMENKCTSITETARILKRNLEKLQEEFPSLTKEFVPKFCCSLGSLRVPQSAFDISDGGFIVQSSDREPSRWSMLPEELESLLENKKTELEHVWNVARYPKVTATVKYVCIEDFAKSGMGNFIRALLISNAPVNVFNTEIVKWAVHWKWTRFWRNWFVLRCLLHFVLLICFSIFALQERRVSVAYEYPRGGNERTEHLKLEYSQTDHALLKMSYLICMLEVLIEFVQLVNLFSENFLKGMIYYASSPWNLLKILYSLIMIIWFAPEFWLGNYTSAIIVKVPAQWILIWMAVSRFLPVLF